MNSYSPPTHTHFLCLPKLCSHRSVVLHGHHWEVSEGWDGKHQAKITFPFRLTEMHAISGKEVRIQDVLEKMRDPPNRYISGTMSRNEIAALLYTMHN